MISTLNSSLTCCRLSRFLGTLSAPKESLSALPFLLTPSTALNFDLEENEQSPPKLRCSFSIFSEPPWSARTFSLWFWRRH